MQERKRRANPRGVHRATTKLMFKSRSGNWFHEMPHESSRTRKKKERIRLEQKHEFLLCSLPDTPFLSVNHVVTHCSHKRIAFSQSQSVEDGHCTTPPMHQRPLFSS